MDINFLKLKISEKFKNQENFADALGVSRRTLANWFSAAEVPTEKLYSIFELLDLSGDDEELILNLPKLNLVYRTKFKMTSDGKNESQFLTLAETFMKISPAEFEKKKLPTFQRPYSLEGIISSMRSIFCISETETLTLIQVIEKLKDWNVSVIFFPFSKIGIDVSRDSREVAFTAFMEDRIIIFLDTGSSIDEALFNLIHELTHILCGHSGGIINADDETFCNKVAQEIIYPKMFFLKNSKLKNLIENCDKYDLKFVQENLNKIFLEFDWCPMGLALSFKGLQFLSANSLAFKRLMYINKTHKLNSKPLEKLFFSNLNVKDFDSLEKFFENDIFTNKDICKGFIDLKNAATFGHISSRRLAEIFDANPGDIDELIKKWGMDANSLDKEQLDGPLGLQN